MGYAPTAKPNLLHGVFVGAKPLKYQMHIINHS